MKINILLIAVSILAIWLAGEFPVDEAAAFPSWVAWIILILSILDIAISACKSGKGGLVENKTSGSEISDNFDASSLIMAAMTAAYLLLMPFLGFIFSSGLFCAGVLRAQVRMGLLRAAAFGYGFSAFVYAIFAGVMNVALPVGFFN